MHLKDTMNLYYRIHSHSTRKTSWAGPNTKKGTFSKIFFSTATHFNKNKCMAIMYMYSS